MGFGEKFGTAPGGFQNGLGNGDGRGNVKQALGFERRRRDEFEEFLLFVGQGEQRARATALRLRGSAGATARCVFRGRVLARIQDFVKCFLWGYKELLEPCAGGASMALYVCGDSW